jgi:hypothetical protein
MEAHKMEVVRIYGEISQVIDEKCIQNFSLKAQGKKTN